MKGLLTEESSGDGGLFDVLNGLWSRDDWETIREHFSIGVVGRF